jgi:hypothetical protein
MLCGSDTCNGLRCVPRTDADGGAYWWQAMVCNGPLPPPEGIA